MHVSVGVYGILLCLMRCVTLGRVIRCCTHRHFVLIRSSDTHSYLCDGRRGTLLEDQYVSCTVVCDKSNVTYKVQ